MLLFERICFLLLSERWSMIELSAKGKVGRQTAGSRLRGSCKTHAISKHQDSQGFTRIGSIKVIQVYEGLRDRPTIFSCKIKQYGGIVASWLARNGGRMMLEWPSVRDDENRRCRRRSCPCTNPLFQVWQVFLKNSHFYCMAEKDIKGQRDSKSHHRRWRRVFQFW